MVRQMEHLDSAETVFFLRELMEISKQSYDVKYAQLKGMLYLPVKNDLDPAAESYTYRTFDMLGAAKRMTSPADDAPMVNTKGVESTQRLQSYQAAFGYSIDEIRAAQKAGRPLDRMRATAARKVLDQKLDDICAVGDSTSGLTGLLNVSGTSLYTVPTGVGGYTFAQKTPDEILLDLNGMVDKIVVDTKEVEKPNRILLPTAQFRHISTTARSTVSDTTIKQFFEANNPGISVESWERLAGAGGGGIDIMLAYDANVLNLHLLMAIQFEQQAPQLQNWAYKVNVRMKTGGVISPYPKSICLSQTHAI